MSKPNKRGPSRSPVRTSNNTTNRGVLEGIKGDDETAIIQATSEGMRNLGQMLIPNSSRSYLLVDGTLRNPTICIQANHGPVARILVSHYLDSGLYFGSRIDSTNLQRGSSVFYSLQPGWHDITPGTYEHRIIATVIGPIGSTLGASSTIRYKEC
jgi:hypothetical protein